MKLIVLAAGLIIFGSWILGRMLFQGKKGPLKKRDKRNETRFLPGFSSVGRPL